MNRSFALLLLSVALSGCATFEPTELSQIRSRGVAPQTVDKLDRGRALGPADVAELTRRGVPDRLIIRQIEDHGVDSLISRSDVASLRRTGVHSPVIEAMLRASDEFEGDHRGPRVTYAGAYYGPAYYGDPYFYDPYPWYGGVGFSFPVGGHFHHGGHR
jgi:hypothetical protein